MYRNLVYGAALLSLASGQLVGTELAETHPGMTWQSCTAKGSCTSKSGKVVIDANWRWLHVKGGYVCTMPRLRLLLTAYQIHQLLHRKRVEHDLVQGQQVLCL